MAHAIVFSTIGDPDVLRLIEIPDPVPGPGEVLVRIDAAGVNPLDAKQRSGIRPVPLNGARRVGFDGAGTVLAVGDDVARVAEGDRVAVHNTLGTYATHVVTSPQHLSPLPDVVSAPEGAALGIPAGTAFQALRSLDVGTGDILLVHAGSGSVGQAVIQFAVAAGATVIATARPARHDRLRDLGAIPVAYGEGLAERVRELSPGAVTVAIDAAGTDEAITASLALVADRARIATLVRGADAPGFGIRAFSGGSPDPLSPQELAWRAEAIPAAIDLLARGRFSVELGPQLPLAEAAEAHRLVEAGAPGKITLVP